MRRALVRGLRALRREEGSATIELCLLLPMFIILLTSAVETGVMLTRYMMLERALDVNLRNIRLGANPTRDELAAAICDRAGILPACRQSLVLEMRKIDKSTWTLPDADAPCYNRQEDITPATQFSYGSENEIMLIRACIIVDPFLPSIGLGKTIADGSNGQFYLRTASAFVNEPS
ncbi:TadE/TadG family type IV pilus assembly protein [Brevirhabdus sp.]|uniref:TadE/TadG family type IV pilus assembly protein n=1 Tax=Brevirhabdus sp. TaxID=2004514 RepID=UPI00405995E0